MSFDFGYHFGFRLGGGAPTPPPPPPPDPDFVMLVKTDNAGTSGTNQFTIPTTGGGYNYTVTTSEQTLTGQTGNVTLTWATAGVYEVRISGTFPRIFFNNGGDRLKLIETVNFGTVGWNSMVSAFWGCSNHVINANATGDFSLVIDYTFSWFSCNLTFFPSTLDFKNGQTFSSTFRGNNFGAFPAYSFDEGLNFDSCWFQAGINFFGACYFPKATNMSNAWRLNGVIDSFETRNFYAMTNGTSCFQNTTLPTSDYSDILVTQRANNNNNNVTFHGGSSKYNTAGGVARAELTDLVANGGQAWAITDGGAE
jgi:hypothetical protein